MNDETRGLQRRSEETLIRTIRALSTDGQVIDGRHRVKACGELGRSVDARVYHGEGDAVMAFVVSLNLKRRHLNESQRAMVGARLANLGNGQRADYAAAALIQAASQSDVAEQLQVSRFSIQRGGAGQERLEKALEDNNEILRQIAENTRSPERVVMRQEVE